MHLLKLEPDSEFRSVEVFGSNIPQYAILSHTWGASADEVNYRDIQEGTGKNKIGFRKLRFCGEQAAADGLQYIWIDTCCIDKSSSAELSEAINSMFRWYSELDICYIYLTDVSMPVNSTTNSDKSNRHIWEPALRKSRWFTRGWTLQELLAPKSVEFFSAEGRRLGDKRSLRRLIHEVTGIATEALQGYQLSYFSVDDRISWGSNRKTTREEDAAYSQLGIFDIHMPLIYGEGRRKAMARLHKEIQESMNVLSNTIIGDGLGDSEENKFQQYSSGQGESSAHAVHLSNAKVKNQDRTTYGSAIQKACSTTLQMLKNHNIENNNWISPLKTIPTNMCRVTSVNKILDRESPAGVQIEEQQVRDLDDKILCSLPLAFQDAQREICNIEATAWSILSEQGSLTYIIELLEDWEDARYNLQFERETLKSTVDKCYASIKAISAKFRNWYNIIKRLQSASVHLRGGRISDSRTNLAILEISFDWLDKLQETITPLLLVFESWQYAINQCTDKVDNFLKRISTGIEEGSNPQVFEAINVSSADMEESGHEREIYVMKIDNVVQGMSANVGKNIARHINALCQRLL